jgi:hypothetical protein
MQVEGDRILQTSPLYNAAQHSTVQQSRAEQSRAEQSRAEQSRAEQSRAEQSRAEQSRAEQSRAEQSRAEHSTADKGSKSLQSDSLFLLLYNFFFIYLSLVLFLTSLLCTDRSCESDFGCYPLVPSFGDLYLHSCPSFSFHSFILR